ncbi:hypothetical protein BC834DRAFT_1005720 [Gloeopeniophorella convolvens]|nr:hypothetical protein BC834DRAFT_1005720 [Gloeopeniophorella convolvens]
MLDICVRHPSSSQKTSSSKYSMPTGSPSLFWGDRRGWYKLVHVCRRWRKLVLSWASRLELYAHLTAKIPAREMLAHFPSLPITVHYTPPGSLDCLVTALEHPARVHVFYVNMPPGPDLIFWLFSQPLPALARFDLRFTKDARAPCAARVGAAVARVRSLTIHGLSLPTLAPLLMSTTALVSLALENICPMTHLQLDVLRAYLCAMPFLRNLILTFRVTGSDHPAPLAPSNRGITPFAHLESHRFDGSAVYLEELLDGAAAPYLKELNASLFRVPFTPPHLLVFHSDYCRLWLTAQRGLDTGLPPCGIKIRVSARRSQATALAQLCASLLAVQEVSFVFHPSREPWVPEETIPAPWRDLLARFRSMRTLLVDVGMAEVIPGALAGDEGSDLLHVLPALEEVHVQYLMEKYSEASTRRAFCRSQPFFDARERSGRLVKVLYTAVSHKEWAKMDWSQNLHG